MSKLVNARVQMLILSSTGQVPTVPSNPALTPESESWLATDLLKGEWAINTADEILFQRIGNDIKKIFAFDYKGKFANASALTTAWPNGSADEREGWFARVGTAFYVWDLTTDAWVELSGGGGAWGEITGTLADQTDLDNALAALEDQDVYTTALGSLPMPEDVGGIPAGTTAADLNGRTASSLFDDLFFPTVLATITAAKSATLTHNGPSGSVEVGTALSFTLTATFNRGTITDGDGSTTHNLVGVATGYTFTGTGISSTAQAGNTLAVAVAAVLGDNDWDVVVAHAAGTEAYYDNKSNAGTNLDGSRGSGSTSDTNASPNITGYYKRFYAPVSGTPADSAAVRALNNELDSNNTFTLNTGNTLNEFVVYVENGRSISSVVDQDALNAVITSSYVLLGTKAVDDAGGTSRTYKEYKMTIAGPYSSNHRHFITLS